MQSRLDIITAAMSHGVSEETASIAADRILRREVVMLGFSGKLASGKDSVASGVVNALGLDPVVHMSFAQPLKDEVDQAIELIRSTSPSEARQVLHVANEAVFDEFVNLLTSALQEAPEATARTRTAGIRRVLQFWGTEVRRAELDEYWVSKAVSTALSNAAAGRHLFFTDGRFPNEIAGSQTIGFLVVRLEVSPDVQAQRLAARDGLAPDPLSLIHPSETALDSYQGFDLVTDNEGSFDATVDYVSTWVRSHMSRH